ncbi:HAD-IB family hydrolase [Polymorphobacter arshaanensis]|uniref:HAD-IB family hydrolase n=1 Tax=Glacieibacterium arshaanense TaxID=2511025 RepID=A0A4Y9ELU3_9SPHN|nr:HAD-IB family hydrolase [Polymorphobacter arshaanensis]TFU01340.1 HAD-IB family hydrolase [Polymorphobacter arshaanensis]
MQHLAVYDLDKTITHRATYAAWLLFWARQQAPWRLLLVPMSAVAGLLYVLKLINRARLKTINHALLMGRADVATVAAEAAAFATHQVATNVRAGALAQIAADRAEGRRIVIATASYRFYAGAIGAALGIDDVIGTRAVIAGGALLPQIDGENCYAAAKRAMVEDWLAAHALTGAPMRFYSDHPSDAPMFELADEPVAANPNRALRALAQARDWAVVDWE